MRFSWLWCFLNNSPVESWKHSTVTWIFVLDFFFLACPLYSRLDTHFFFSCSYFSWLSLPFQLLRDISLPSWIFSSFHHFLCVITIQWCLWHIAPCQQTRIYKRLLSRQNLSSGLQCVLIWAISLFHMDNDFLIYCFYSVRIRLFFVPPGKSYNLPTQLWMPHCQIWSSPHFIQEQKGCCVSLKIQN